MTEQIIREGLAEKERLKDRVDDANRFGRIESTIAVLQTRFEAWIERAVQGEDLKELKREMEAELLDTVGGFKDSLAGTTSQQSKDILGEVRGMFSDFKMQIAQDQLNQQNALLDAQRRMQSRIIWWGLGLGGAILASVISALIIFYLTGR